MLRFFISLIVGMKYNRTVPFRHRQGLRYEAGASALRAYTHREM